MDAQSQQPLLGRDSPASEVVLDADDDAELAASVLRKIDQRLLPLLFITYMLNFMDKTILSSAVIFGLLEDTNLERQQYSWVGSVFYFGYLLWEYPTTVLIARLPVGRYLAANTLFWGCVVGLTAACTNFAGLMTVRFLLGVAEATITPGFMFLTSTWYTRDEMPTRVGFWFAGNSVGGLVSSLFAYAIGHIQDQVHPWRWMYIILGITTFLWAAPMFMMLPDSISKAKFLGEKERQVAMKRVVVAGTGRTERVSWRWEQFRECLVDPKTWLILAIELLIQIPNGGTQLFANIIIKTFGFTALQTTLVNIPYSMSSAGVIFGTGYLAGQHRTLNCLLIVAVVIPCVIGSVVIYCRQIMPQSTHLMAYFLLSAGPAAMPLNMALVQSNYRGVTKKMTMTAMLFVVYCLGNIIGPHLFRDAEAPTYATGFQAIVICYMLVMSLTLVLRWYLQSMNTKREKMAALRRDTQDPEASSTRGEIDELGDLTDWEVPDFMYRL